MSNIRRYTFLSLFSLLLLAAVGVVTSCKPSVPQGVMSEGKLEDVLYDYNLALAIADNTPVPEGSDREAMRYQYVQKVFEKYGITEAYFDSTMVWYSSEGKRLSGIFKRVNERMDAEAKTLGVDLSETELYASYGLDGDTANVWSGSRIVYLSNYQPDNVKVITLLADSTYLPGDCFKLSCNNHFLPSQGSHSAYVMFSAYYADSSVVSAHQQIGGNYRVELNLTPTPRQDTLALQRLVITLYEPPISEYSSPDVFYISQPAVLRIHKPVDKSQKTSDDDDASEQTSAVDSLAVDSIGNVGDTIQRRLTPIEERDLREERHDIEIVKERIVRPANNRRPSRRIMR